ncbi:MAG: hypothetical protein AAF806_12320 [Bacteroidota bacterium]
MTKHCLFVFTTFILCMTCSTPETEVDLINFQLDHLILFVQDEQIKDQLDQIFTPADLLQSSHSEQGTLGKYYLFLNANLELLYPQNDSIIEQNEPYFGSSYQRRWSEDGFAGIGIGLKMKPFDTSAIDFPYHLYQHPNWDTTDYYIMSEVNQKVGQPLVFIVTPKSEQKVFNSLAEASEEVRPEIRADVMKYLTHPTTIKRLTKVEFSVPKSVDIGVDNWSILERTSLVSLSQTDHYGLQITFDKGIQQQSILIDSMRNITINY